MAIASIGIQDEGGCREQSKSEAANIAEKAIDALFEELELHPKPGLVTPASSGSHRDMDFDTMADSIEAIAPFLHQIAETATRACGFQDDLRPLGVAAEEAMLEATAGVNTHRGAIFSMGLLVAASVSAARFGSPSADSIRSTLLASWGDELAEYANAGAPRRTHGANVRRTFGVGGAPRAAADGFPDVFEIGVPTLIRGYADGLDHQRARMHTLLTLMATVHDSNVYSRAGLPGCERVWQATRAVLETGGGYSQTWKESARQLDRELVAQWISPGGSADLLAASIFINSVTKPVELRLVSST